MGHYRMEHGMDRGNKAARVRATGRFSAVAIYSVIELPRATIAVARIYIVDY